MFPIFVVGAWGFYIVLGAINQLGRDFYRSDFQQLIHNMAQHLNAGDHEAAAKFLHQNKGRVAHELWLSLQHPDWSSHRIHNDMRIRMGKQIQQMDQGMHLATVLAATAPLLGLLGTVTGMVSTFEVITQYGNSNPVLLADGISEALITTQSGLLIAFPMTLLLRRVEERSNWVRKQMELGMAIIQNWAQSRPGES